MSTNEAELQAILADIQAEIQRHRRTLDPIGDGPSDPILKARQFQRVNSHLPIGWPVMPSGVVPKLLAYAQKTTRVLLRWYINPIVDQQNHYNAAVMEALETLASQGTQQARQITFLEGAIAERDRWISDLVARVGEASQWLQTQEGEQAALGDRISTLATRLEGITAGSVAPAGGAASLPLQAGAPASHPDDYRDLFATLGERAPGGMVLLIAPSPAPFVAHLQTQGLVPTSLPAIPGESHELQAALTALGDGSLQGFVWLHPPVGWSPNEVAACLQVAAQKLAPGGLLLIESPKPAPLSAPDTGLHPQLLAFLLTQAGFSAPALRWLHPAPAHAQLPSLPPAPRSDLEPLAAQFNATLAHLNALLYGAQDYAAIAYKPE